MYSFFDIHSHLHDKAFDADRDAVIVEMKARGFGTITIGTDIEESKKAIKLAEENDNIYATVGFHPNDIDKELFSTKGGPASGWDEKIFEELAEHKKVVAIGECGLDYFYLKENIEQEKEKQKEIFEKQIALAVKVNKPLMLHGRPSKGSMDAYEDMLQILESEKIKHEEKLKGNAHFFAGNVDIAKRFIDIGFTVSFSGVITFTHDYDDVVRYVPVDMMHAETDSPYATPAPFRGKRNSPLYVQEVVAKIAVLRQEPMEEIRTQLLLNAKRFFGV